MSQRFYCDAALQKACIATADICSTRSGASENWIIKPHIPKEIVEGESAYRELAWEASCRDAGHCLPFVGVWKCMGSKDWVPYSSLVIVYIRELLQGCGNLLLSQTHDLLVISISCLCLMLVCCE